MAFDRRDFLRFGAIGTAGALTQRLAAFGNSPLRPIGNADGKVMYIFLRGGNDGVNTVIPFGDLTYPSARGGLAISPTSSDAIVIPNSSYAGLNAGLTRLQPAMAAGHVAFLHAVGTDNPTRSHFVEMQKIETAEDVPAAPLGEEGFVPRLIQRLHLPGVAPTLAGVSIARQIQRMFLTVDRDRIMLHLRSLADYSFGTPAPLQRMKGLPPSPTDPEGDALWGCCVPTGPTNAIDELIRATGEKMCASEDLLRTQVTEWLYAPGNNHDGVRYPTTPAEASGLGATVAEQQALDSYQCQTFLREVEEGMAILKQTTTNVVGIDLGAFDTHADQKVEQKQLLHMLGWAMGSAYADSVQNGMKLVVLVVTEFGRTNLVNGNLGTDHGVGTLCMAMGPTVNGGVYNCSATPSLQFGAAWNPLVPPMGTVVDPRYENAVQPQTHFQTVIAEVCERHLGMSPADVDIVVPGINSRTGRLYRRLGYL